MFKLHFVELCNINSRISLKRVRARILYWKLNKITVRMYHQLYGTGK
jgi:uncharacterized protein YqiB (DUF1249 family)